MHKTISGMNDDAMCQFINSHFRFLLIFSNLVHIINIIGLRLQHGSEGNLDTHLKINDHLWSPDASLGCALYYLTSPSPHLCDNFLD